MKYISEYLNKLSAKPVKNLFIIYLTIYLAIVFLMLFILKIPPTYFLHDDGYYQIGKDFYYGVNTLSNKLVTPLFPFLLSGLNFFPEILHPFIRIIFTIIIVFLNLLISYKIFQNILTDKQFFTGVLIMLLNPIFYHWTIKSTPELYVAFFLGIIILSIKEYLLTYNPVHFIAILVFLTAGTLFKPVLVLIPFAYLFYFVLKKQLKYVFVFLFIFIYAVSVQLFVMKYSEPMDRNGMNYANVSLLSGYFFTEGILHTKRIDFGSDEKFYTLYPEKSNLQYINNNMYKWIEVYKKNNPTASDMQMVFSYIMEKPGIFVLSKILSPILFISVASAYPETIMNLFLNGFIILLSFVGMKKIRNKNIAILILISLLGYYTIFFLTFSFARYSLPLLLYLSPFAGIILSKKVKDKYS